MVVTPMNRFSPPQHHHPFITRRGNGRFPNFNKIRTTSRKSAIPLKPKASPPTNFKLPEAPPAMTTSTVLQASAALLP
jgi:hypothetical protein